MRYSNKLEVIAMMLLWTMALIWYDLSFNQHLFNPQFFEQAQKFPTPQVSMWIQHVGCSGKTEPVVQALTTLPWLGTPEVRRANEMPGAEAEAHTKPASQVQCDI